LQTIRHRFNIYTGSCVAWRYEAWFGLCNFHDIAPFYIVTSILTEVASIDVEVVASCLQHFQDFSGPENKIRFNDRPLQINFFNLYATHILDSKLTYS